jgi:hypothetical protein
LEEVESFSPSAFIDVNLMEISIPSQDLMEINLLEITVEFQFLQTSLMEISNFLADF